ncbi:MAG: hypothetical protein RSB06_02325 [Clostridia bacterium]
MQDQSIELRGDFDFQCATCTEDDDLSKLCEELLTMNHLSRIDDAWQFESCRDARLTLEKCISPDIAYEGTELCITTRVCNPSEKLVRDVFFQESLDATIVFEAGSVCINGCATGCETLNPEEGFCIGCLAPNESCEVAFRACTLAGASPVRSIAYAAWNASVCCEDDIPLQIVCSNPFYLVRLKYNFSQACADVAESVALMQTAIAHILNAEGEKIQALLQSPCVTLQELLEANESVEALLDAVNRLELIFQQVLSTVIVQLINCLNPQRCCPSSCAVCEPC